MTVLAYARVSTAHQSVDMQVQALEAAGAERIWTEQMSGGRDDRPELAALLDYARAGDVLMVWRLDRLGRSLPHLLTVVADLDARGVQLRSLTEAIDTTTAGADLCSTCSPRSPSLSARWRPNGRPPGWRPPGRPAVYRAGRNCPPQHLRRCASSTRQAHHARISLDRWVFHDPVCTGRWQWMLDGI